MNFFFFFNLLFVLDHKAALNRTLVHSFLNKNLLNLLITVHQVQRKSVCVWSVFKKTRAQQDTCACILWLYNVCFMQGMRIEMFVKMKLEKMDW